MDYILVFAVIILKLGIWIIKLEMKLCAGVAQWWSIWLKNEMSAVQLSNLKSQIRLLHLCFSSVSFEWFSDRIFCLADLNLEKKSCILF